MSTMPNAPTKHEFSVISEYNPGLTDFSMYSEPEVSKISFNLPLKSKKMKERQLE